jgi:hypothetical protein
MTRLPSNHRSWLQKLLGVKSDRQIAREVAREPEVKKARKLLKEADHVLAEIEAVERREH